MELLGSRLRSVVAADSIFALRLLSPHEASKSNQALDSWKPSWCPYDLAECRTWKCILLNGERSVAGGLSFHTDALLDNGFLSDTGKSDGQRAAGNEQRSHCLLDAVRDSEKLCERFLRKLTLV